MGMYLVSVGAQDWSVEGEDGYGDLAAALNEELGRRGLPSYDSVPEETDLVRGSGMSFEEKLVPSMDGLSALCRTHLSPEEFETLLDWSLLVPFSLDDSIELPVESAYTDSTTVVGAPQLLAVAEKLAVAIRLPVDEIPATSDNLDLTMWFLDGDVKETAAVRPGPWSQDLDTAFYVAMYLRAAQHSIRRGCPMTYC